MAAKIFVRAFAGVAMATAAGWTLPALAQSAKEKELEARIEQLEKLVRELSNPAQATPAPAPAPAATPAAAPLQTKPITPNALAGTRFLFSGFIKLDTHLSKYADGEIADGSIGRDFYLPSSIPIGGADEGPDLDAHVKHSRFILGTDTDVAGKGLLSSRLEFDLYGSSLGDERATNTYGLQLRHAYLQYGNWLAGQTWSNFQDAAALPETTDYIGPTDGTIFVRQPLVRYTAGNFSIAFENPETTITPFGGGVGGNARIASDDNNIPDVTAAYTFKFGPHYVRAAALARQLKYETTGVGAIDDTIYGGGLSLSGKFALGSADELRFMATAGRGLGRYVGVNFTNDAVLDAAGELEAIRGWAAFAAWRHAWTPQLRSTLMISTSDYDNDRALTGLAVNAASLSWAANLFYTPTPKLDVGLELRQAEREIESGADGTLRRLQGVAKYSF